MAPTVLVDVADGAVRILAGVALSGRAPPALPVLPAATATGFRVTLTCCPNGTEGMTVILLAWLRPMRTCCDPVAPVEAAIWGGLICIRGCVVMVTGLK